MKGTEGGGGGGAGLAKKSFGVMCQPRMEGGRDGGTRTAKCRLLAQRASERAQVRKKGTDAALKVEGRIFPSSDIALTHGEKKRRSCFGRKLREVKRLQR